MKKVTLTAFLLTAIMTSPVSAGCLAKQKHHHYLDINIGSNHDCSTNGTCGYAEDNGQIKAYNEKNWGGGYTYLQTVTGNTAIEGRLGATVGYYRNSINRNTFYAMGIAEANCNVNQTWSIAGGIQAGGGTGYSHISDYPITPVGQIYIRGEYDLPDNLRIVDALSVKVGYLPEIELKNDINPEIFTLQFGVKF
jgi:hypothetical protein